LVDIIIDSREGDKDYFFVELINAGFRPKIEKLDAGDFLIYGVVEKTATLIEHKTPTDFLSSLEGKKNEDGSWEIGRLWDQLKRMRETKIGERLLLISGNPLDKRYTVFRKKGFNKHRIWGSYRGIAKFDTHIIRLKNKEEVVEYLCYLIRRKSTPKKEFTLRASPPKSMSLKEKRLYVLQSLPNIGAKTSKVLLEKYKTLKAFFNDLDNIDKLIGIGLLTKESIKKVYEEDLPD